MDEAKIEAYNVNVYKKMIKAKIREAALSFLKKKQETHSKVRDIVYTKLETQRYLTSPLFSDEEVSLLFAIRSQCVRECRANFSSMHSEIEILCKLCTKKKRDDQPHILQCNTLNSKLETEELATGEISYQDIYGNHIRQKEVTSLFSKLLSIKKKFDEKDDQNIKDPSTLSTEVLKTSYNLQPSIVNFSSGK